MITHRNNCSRTRAVQEPLASKAVAQALQSFVQLYTGHYGVRKWFGWEDRSRFHRLKPQAIVVMDTIIKMEATHIYTWS
jgi:hypothetical protein